MDEAPVSGHGDVLRAHRLEAGLMPAATGAEVAIRDIPRIDHREAMQLAETENARLLDMLGEVTAEDWAAPTDCTHWDVRAIVVHLIASAQAQANPLEFARQVAAGRRHGKRLAYATHWVDGMNEAQLQGRQQLRPTELSALWATASAAALRARRRLPAPIRSLPVLPLGEIQGIRLGWQRLGYLFDIGFTRDVWMHRVDIARATGKPLRLSADHDGRLIADIAAEWAIRHDQPVTLQLRGVAGGRYAAHGGGEQIALDAVQFCRILSGRAPGTGVLRHALPL
jgi:uncharacterized protein (TIGR03083 family)